MSPEPPERDQDLAAAEADILRLSDTTIAQDRDELSQALMRCLRQIGAAGSERARVAARC
jgi:hypothetical protein